MLCSCVMPGTRLPFSACLAAPMAETAVCKMLPANVKHVTSLQQNQVWFLDDTPNFNAVLPGQPCVCSCCNAPTVRPRPFASVSTRSNVAIVPFPKHLLLLHEDICLNPQRVTVR